MSDPALFMFEKRPPNPPRAVRAGGTPPPETSIDRELSEIADMLARIAGLAARLKADPDGHVSRSVEELRQVFIARGVVEPAIARVRASMTMLRSSDHFGRRREFQRRALGLDHLRDVVERELLPALRRLGFDL
jgi:hypothetical protein